MRSSKSIVIIVLLLLILTGGVYITSGLFQEFINRPKSYFLLVSLLLLLLSCFVSSKGVQKLLDSLKSRGLLYGVTVVCLLTTVHGFLQYFGIMPSYHRAFPITGSFENPAGFAAVQAAMFPFVFNRCFAKDNGRFMIVFCAIVSSLCAASVILAGSRTGFLAICASVVVVLIFTDSVASFLKTHRWMWPLLFLMMLSSIILLYYIKKDSADGRVFIWNRCFELIKERPLFGYGVYGFQGNYMIAQANYFRSHPDSGYVMLADNITHPFNEYLKLTVNYGLIGLFVALTILIWIVYRLFQSDMQTKVLGLSFVSSIFVTCQFSYPFMYKAVYLLAFIAIIPAFVDAESEINIPRHVKIIVSSLLVGALVLSFRAMYYEMKWTEIAKRSMQGRAERMLPYYKVTNNVLGKNPLFLYNYAAELDAAQHYEESLDVLTECSKSWNEYNVQILYTDIYFRLGQMDNALKACEEAYYMVPSRFAPLYRKMLIHVACNDMSNAIDMANTILDKPIKIQSEELNNIISVAEGIISQYEDESH